MSELNGVRLMITRPADASSAWDSAITARGAVPVHVPLVQTRRLRGSEWAAALHTIEELSNDTVIALSSARAAEHWHTALQEAAINFSVIATVVVGEATAVKARALGMEVEVAGEANAMGLAKTIESLAPPTATLVFPRAVHGRTEAIDYLKGTGRTVRPISLYETNPVSNPETADPAPVHWILSASPSAVRAYGWHKAALVRLGLLLPQTCHAVIGATTAEAAAKVGITTQAESSEPTIDAILDALTNAPTVRLPES